MRLHVVLPCLGVMALVPFQLMYQGLSPDALSLSLFSFSCSLQDIKLTRDKLQCMAPTVWLNDEAINLYMLLLQVGP